MLTERILVNEEDLDAATGILDDFSVDYELDGSDRIMCSEDDVDYILELFDDNDVDYILELFDDNGIDADLI